MIEEDGIQQAKMKDNFEKSTTNKYDVLKSELNTTLRKDAMIAPLQSQLLPTASSSWKMKWKSGRTKETRP